MSAHICGKSGSVLAVGADVLDLDTRHAQADDGARRRHPVVGVGAPHPAVKRPRGDDEPVGGLLALAAEPVELGAQRGEPVGLVAAQVRDAAAAATPTPAPRARPAPRPTERVRRRRAGRRRSPRTASGPVTSRCESVWRTTAPIWSSRSTMVSDGCTLARGQPVTRTCPPVTIAAARNGTALDRSGSMIQWRAAIGPGSTRQRLVVASSTATPASPQHRDRHRDVRCRGHRRRRCGRRSARR